MLMLGDLDLNSVPRCTESLKEVVKLTMLEQEVVFRKQVHELHRLYRQQESLMKDLAYTGWDRYTLWNLKAQSFLLPLTNPTRHETLAKEASFSSVPEESKPLASWELLEEHQGTYCGLQQRSPALQFSADEFINHVKEHRTKKENVRNHVKENVDLEHPAHAAFSLVPEELKLSLGIEPDNTRLRDAMENMFDKKTDCFSQGVIDLEDSAKRMSEGYEKSKTNSTSKLESQVSDFFNPIILTREKRDSFHPIPKSGYFQQPSECCQGQTSFSRDGIRGCHEDITGNGPSVKEQRSIPHQRRYLDLNENLDDSSCYSNDPLLATPTAASLADGSTGFIRNFQEGTFSIAFWEKEVNESSSKNSDIIEEDNRANFALMDLNSARETAETSIRISNCNEGSSGKVSLIGPDSTSRPPVGMFECVGRCSSNHKNENVDLKSNHVNDVSHNSQHLFTATREANSQKSVECTGFPCTDRSQNKFQDQQSNNPPASCKSHSISDNDTSSGKTAHSCITTDVSNQYSSANIGSGVCNQRTADSSDLNYKCSDKQHKWAEADILTQEAAESLIRISLCNSACYQDFSTKAGSKEPKVDKQEQPQYSSDTFELIALRLTESNLIDDSASSKPLEVNDAETKNFGLKLRRGRRLKDFQREILPGLASLSVHEIREDINIMEGALRSREYRKIRAMMGNLGENYSPLVRSKRSRHNYATRRNSWRKFS